jgi:hypothetical protein
MSENMVNTERKIIKIISGNFQSYDTVVKINSEEGMLTDNKKIANAFNKYYIQLAINLNNKLTNIYRLHCC